jgi:hypothetical protein
MVWATVKSSCASMAVRAPKLADLPRQGRPPLMGSRRGDYARQKFDRRDSYQRGDGRALARRTRGFVASTRPVCRCEALTVGDVASRQPRSDGEPAPFMLRPLPPLPERHDIAAYFPEVRSQPEREGGDTVLDAFAATAPAVAARRAGSGLPDDDLSVRLAIENSQRPDYPWPGPLYTSAEEAELANVDRGLVDQAEKPVEDDPGVLGSVGWCWREGRRGVHVAVTRDVEHYRRLLTDALGADRVVVTSAQFSHRELDALQTRIGEDVSALDQLGVDVDCIAGDDDAVVLEYFASDADGSARHLRERYGLAVRPVWLGPARMVEKPQLFGSWVIAGTRLTVLYPLMRNRCLAGHCSVEEHPDRVIVFLTALVSQGSAPLSDSFEPSSATVQLSAPLGDRRVIDAANGEPRPKWIETTAAS